MFLGASTMSKLLRRFLSPLAFISILFTFVFTLYPLTGPFSGGSCTDSGDFRSKTCPTQFSQISIQVMLISINKRCSEDFSHINIPNLHMSPAYFPMEWWFLRQFRSRIIVILKTSYIGFSAFLVSSYSHGCPHAPAERISSQCCAQIYTW